MALEYQRKMFNYKKGIKKISPKKGKGPRAQIYKIKLIWELIKIINLTLEVFYLLLAIIHLDLLGSS